MVGWFNRRLRRDREGGAALVEFAILLPLLVTLLIGIMEFGWAFGNNLDVRHGAREAARLAAVDHGTVVAMGTSACASMDFSTGEVITFTVSDVLGELDSDGDGIFGEVGDLARVDVLLNPYNSLTGFMDWALPASLSTEVEIRLEQEASWVNGNHTCS